MRAFRYGLLLILVVGISGCMPPSPELISNWVTPIQTALSADRQALSARAFSGDAHAQFALAIQYEHGISGLRDPARGAALRQMALAQRGSTMTPIYVPGVDGRPGYTMMISTPTYMMTAQEAAAIDACVNWIVRSAQAATPVSPTDGHVCGGPAHREGYLALWISTISHNVS